jgi:hypothetical protein
MTIHPCLFPTLFAAAVSVAAAAFLRRAVRKEFASLLPFLIPWGALCTIPALAFAVLCLPPFADMADRLNEAIAGTWFELLAGIAGVLPGLLWDEIAERLETNRELPFRLPAAALRTGMVAALLILILLPYGFLFSRRPAGQAQPSAQAQPVQTQPAQTTEAPAPNS